MLHVIELPPSRYSELPMQVNPASSRVVALEDVDTKEIKGFWCAVGVTHIEPVWIDESVRDGGHSAIKMLQTLLSTLAANGDPFYYSFSDSPEISDYLSRLGMTRMPYEIWMGINPLLKKEDS